MTEKLTRRGVRVPEGYHPDVLTTTAVGEVMSARVATLPATATVADAIARFQAPGHSAYPVVDGDGRPVGIVSRDDLLLLADDDALDTPIGTAYACELVTVAPDDTAAQALRIIFAEGVDHLPVVDADGGLAGICTRTDVLQARRAQLHLEQLQPGWLRRPPRRVITAGPTPATAVSPNGSSSSTG
jgi:CBS domain-containing protein